VEQNPMSAHFFLQDYANTGKTFLYNAICNHFRIKKEIIICVTLSGIAALFFPGGSTSHSRFCIPLNSTQGN
jgi:ATP-dependent DNA helicase PIF1